MYPHESVGIEMGNLGANGAESIISASVQTLGRKDTNRVNRFTWDNIDKVIVNDRPVPLLLLIEGFLIVLGVLIRIVGSCYWALQQLRNVLTKYGLRISLRKWSMSTQSVKPSTKDSSSTSEDIESIRTLPSQAWQNQAQTSRRENSLRESIPPYETSKSSTLGNDLEKTEKPLSSAPTFNTPKTWPKNLEELELRQRPCGEMIQNEWRSYNVTYTAQPPYYAIVPFSLKDIMIQKLVAFWLLDLPRVTSYLLK